MASSSEYFKRVAQNADNRFYGEGNKVKVTNKYFTIKHVLDDDTIIINTNNIRFLKDKPVLIVDSNKGVYLKDWQIKAVHNFENGLEMYLVKLTRQWFRPYEFKFSFDDFCFERTHDFDYLKDVAKSQDIENMRIANGFMG